MVNAPIQPLVTQTIQPMLSLYLNTLEVRKVVMVTPQGRTVTIVSIEATKVTTVSLQETMLTTMM